MRPPVASLPVPDACQPKAHLDVPANPIAARSLAHTLRGAAGNAARIDDATRLTYSPRAIGINSKQTGTQVPL
jgi:hypothetical protein